MDFDREYELEDAGIEAFAFSLMDDDEKVEALREAGLDPDDYDGIEYDSSFDAWASLQSSGVSLRDLEFMDEAEKREAFESAGLDPDDSEIITPGCPPTASEKSMTQNFADPREAQTAPVLYRCCEVNFPDSRQPYSYLTNGLELSAGDIVLVPTGRDRLPQAAKVISLENYTAETAPYPVERMKAVIRKATKAESAPFLPQQPSANPAEDGIREAAGPQTASAPPQTQKQDPVWWIAAVAVLLVILMSFGLNSGHSTAKSTTSTYSASRSAGSSHTYSGTYSSTPTCPPVNRERAMSKEEAARLKGTGYHSTRPNSSAEDIELTAAQTKCKNCGYRTHNGSNSLCDYCAWMERYGGGLPTGKSPDVTPAPTARPTPRPTARPTPKPKSDDPYHAGDYAHPDDFYYDYYDDFWDYEDAEEYWEQHH